MTVNTKISTKNARALKLDSDGLTPKQARQYVEHLWRVWTDSRIQDGQKAMAQPLPPVQPFGSIENCDAISMMRRLRTGTADCVLTDPPYGIDMDVWDPEVPTAEVWLEALRILRPGAFCVVAAAPRTAHLTAAALEAAGFRVRDMLVWRYTQSFPGAQGLGGEWRSNLKTNQEPWIVAQKPLERGLTLRENFIIHGTGGVRTGATGSPGWRTNVLDCPKPKPAERDLGCVPGKNYNLPRPKKSGAWSNSTRGQNWHPTCKPLGLMRALTRLFVPDRGVVVDPFMGSGSTLVAAAAEGHAVFGSDLCRGYWEMACDRVDWAYDHPHLVPGAV
ncbi:MAG: site-specific DNA-methyltransferase [Rhodobacteraceae bacterium]|nr:site-specific DNA-methyltransferase [Paracoccaceae bacterium]MCZ8084996.1 site-specific DNA-methyltransferase [Paracoccaceae bacterium]